MRDCQLQLNIDLLADSMIATCIIDPGNLTVLYANAAFERFVKSFHVSSGKNLLVEFEALRESIVQCMQSWQLTVLDVPEAQHRMELTPVAVQGVDMQSRSAVRCVAVPSPDKATNGNALPIFQHEAFKRVLDFFPHNIWLCHTSGEVFWTNHTSNLFTYNEVEVNDLENTRWVSKIHPDDLERASLTFSKAMMTLKLEPFRYRLRKHTGEYFWFLSTAAPVYGDVGKILYWVGTSINIDTFVQQEQALQAQIDQLYLQSVEEKKLLSGAQQLAASAQKMELVSHLAGGVAHDLNNMLFVMRMNMDSLARKTDASLSGPITAVRDCIKRAARLSTQMAGFSGRMPQSVSVLDPVVLAKDVHGLLLQAVGAEAQLLMEVAEDVHTVRLDRMYLENALINLAINARDASDGRGNVRLQIANQSLERNGLVEDYVLFRVSDEGTGMPDEVLARIWEPFFTTKKSGRGTGLGLPMVKNFVDSSRGFVDVQSAPGKGTMVSMYFPRSGVRAEEMPQAIESTIGGTETVLLVEDDVAVRETLAEVLSSLGYNTITSFNPEHAMVFINSGVKIDLIISDVKMPGNKTVLDLIALLESTSRTPIIFATGYSAEIAVREGLIEGKYPVLFKPFALHEMACKLREVLDRAER